MENHHVQWVNPLFQWPFSIANCNQLPEGVYIYIYLDKHIMKIYIWTNTPNWRTPSFFRGVGQPPTSHILSYYPLYVIHLGIVTALQSCWKTCCAAAVAVKLGLLGFQGNSELGRRSGRWFLPLRPKIQVLPLTISRNDFLDTSNLMLQHFAGWGWSHTRRSTEDRRRRRQTWEDDSGAKTCQ